MGCPAEAWRQVVWREGSKGALVKACARVRVYRTGKHGRHLESSGWLIGERPLEGPDGDRKQYFVWGLDLALVMLAPCCLTLQQSYGPAVIDLNPAAPARGFPPGKRFSGRLGRVPAWVAS